MTTTASVNDSARFLSAIFEPGDVVEVRLLPKERAIGSPLKWWTTAGEFAAKMSMDATSKNDTGYHIYVGANPRLKHGGSKAEDVALARCLVADFDGGVQPPEALERIETAGLPFPTVVLTSGGGTHCWWRLAEPIEDLTAWTGYQRALARVLDSDKAIHDAPRIMRLPGYANLKYPHRPIAAIVDGDVDRRHDIADLDDVLGRAFQTPAGVAPAAPVAVLPGSMSDHSRAFLEGGIVDCDGRRATAFKVACDLAGRGWAEPEAAVAIEDRLRVLGIGVDDLEDVRRQVHNAFKVPRDPRGGNAAPTLEWEPFPIDVLPEPARSFVRSAADSIGCDPAMVALPLLSALAAAIGNTRRLEVKPGWLEPPVLWTSVVAESGSQKTPAFNQAMQFLEKRQTAAFTAHAERLRAYDAELAQHDAEMGAWKQAVRKGNAGLAPAKPVAPVATRYYVSDTTIEAMIPILAGNPRGLLVAVDEQAGWLASFDQYRAGRGGADAPKWLSMHTAGSVVSDRKSSGTAYVPSAAVSVAGGIQPGALRRAIGTQHVENGMLARLLVAMPPRRAKVWHENQPDWGAVTAMAGVFDVLLDDVPTATGEPAVTDFTPEARVAWKPFYNQHGEEQNEATGALASMLAKIEAAAARLALVVHCVRQAAGEKLPHRVDEVSVEAGVTLARWFAREARRVYGVLGAGEAGDGAAGDAAEAFRWIESRGGYATVRNLAHGLRRFRNDTSKAEKIAGRLVAAGKAEWSTSTPGEAGGRPGDGIKLVAR